MSTEATEYLKSINFKLDPDRITSEQVEYITNIGVTILFLCLGGNGRSHIAAQMMTNFSFPSVCLDFGLVYLKDNPNRSTIIYALNGFPRKYSILDNYLELPLYKDILQGIAYTGNYDNFFRPEAEKLRDYLLANDH